MNAKVFRSIVWLLVAACVGILVVLGGLASRPPVGQGSSARVEEGSVPIGSPFAMTAHTGETVTQDTYAGKAWLVFMGFTNCPDICPTTLAEMSLWFEELGAQAARMRGFLVSVDPERDTLERLALYMQSFDDRIVALRPTPEELERFAKAFKVYYKKVETGGGDYTMDHTAGVFMFDTAGKFAGTIDLHEDREIRAAEAASPRNG
jgi:protein SCO1/2